MNTKFVSYARFIAMLLIAVAVLLAPFYSHASAAPLKTTCPTNPSIPSDDIDCATVISSLSSPYTDSSITDVTQATPVQGTDPTDDPQITECNSTSGLYTVWYSYTPASNGEVHLDTSGSGYDTVLAVWTGTRGSLNLIACNDNYNGSPQSDIRFPVQSGITYYFEVAQFSEVLVSSLSAQSEVAPTSSTSLVFHASFRTTSTSNLAPSVPSLLAPANGAIVTTYTPNLDWSNTTLKTGTYFYKYDLQVSTSSNFSSPVITTSIFDLNSSNYSKYLPPVVSLNPNTIYYWRVRACNANGPAGQCSGYSGARYFRTAILPPVLISPSNGFAEQNLRPDFDWQNVTGAGSYNVQISNAINFSTLVVNVNVVASAYTPSVDLPAGFTFYWRVRALAAPGNFGPSGWSEVRNFTTPKPPSTPVLVSPANNALVTNRQPVLDWSNSTVPLGTTFDHYEIQIADNPGFTGFSLIDDNTTTGNITASNYTPASPFNANTKYYWRVRSWGKVGLDLNFSSWSAVWTFREIVDPPVLSGPANGPAVHALRPTFTWTQADTTSVTGYNFQVSKASNFSTLVLNVTVSGAMNQTYTPAVDLPANSTLYWRVRTNGLNGPSAWAYASPWSFSTPNPPSIPMLVSPSNGALITNRQPTLDWNNSTVPLGVTFDHYQIQVATDTTFASPFINCSTAASDVTASQFTDYNCVSPGVPGPLASNTKYYWRVRSWDNVGNYSSWSAVWYFREAIDPPTNLMPPDGSHQTTLRPTFNWDDVSGASGYNIQVSKVNTFATLVLNVSISGVSNSTYTPTANLPGGSKLYWRVRATGANGPSDWAYAPPTGSFTTPNGPPLLSAPTNASVVTSTTPTLSWVAPSLAPGTTFDYYEVQVATDSAFTSPVVDDTSLTSVTPSQFTIDSLSPLSPDTLYYWHVKFFYTADVPGYSTAWSSTWSFKVSIPAPTLISPADGTALDGFTTAFSWDPVAGAGSYNIQISKVPNFSSTMVNATVVGTSFTPANLAGGTLYYWRVRANAASGHYGPSGWSYPVPWSFSTINLPPTPKTPANSSIVTANPPTLTWTVPTSTPPTTTFSYYEVQIATDSAFNNIVDSTPPSTLVTQSAPNYTRASALADNTTFYWHVRYVYSSGSSHTTSWSVTWSFKTPIATPVQVSPPSPPDDPTGTSPIADLTPTFDWDNGSGGDITGAASYTIQVSTNSSFTTTVINLTVSGNANSFYTPTINLASGTKYYWRVRANAMAGYFGPSAWSSIWTFTTSP